MILLEIKFNIKKIHLIVLSLIILISVSIIVFSQTPPNINPNKAAISLQQVAKSSTNLMSVDSDNDQIIDQAEQVSWNGITNVPTPLDTPGIICTNTNSGDANCVDNTGSRTFVGATSTAYDGQEVGGYDGGDAKCVVAFGPGSRMATAADFANGRPTVVGWYNTFVYDFIEQVGARFNDCYGWTTRGPAESGHIWQLIPLPAPSTVACSSSFPILCVR
mgnify:FL=1